MFCHTNVFSERKKDSTVLKTRKGVSKKYIDYRYICVPNPLHSRKPQNNNLPLVWNKIVVIYRDNDQY